MKNEWANQIEERLIELAARVVAMSEKLPKSFAGSHIGKQVLRSGTSPAPNFGEARGAESDADFIHKLKIVLKELNETQIWVKILIKSKIVSADKCGDLLRELGELSRIVNASINSTKKRLR